MASGAVRGRNDRKGKRCGGNGVKKVHDGGQLQHPAGHQRPGNGPQAVKKAERGICRSEFFRGHKLADQGKRYRIQGARNNADAAGKKAYGRI